MTWIQNIIKLAGALVALALLLLVIGRTCSFRHEELGRAGALGKLLFPSDAGGLRGDHASSSSAHKLRGSTHAAEVKPHIVMVVFDDVGHSDTTVHRPASEVGWSTPNLQRLANKEGVLLTAYYTQSVCSPTRSALLTSRYPFRTGLQHRWTVFGTSLAHIPLDTPTLPELLSQEAGYETHMIGKWHLGMSAVKYTPTSRGFSTFFGIMQGMTDYWTQKVGGGFDLWDIDAKRDPKSTQYRRGAREFAGNHSEVLYRQRLNKIITRYNKEHPKGSLEREEHPLFLYMAHQSIHIPIQAIRLEKDRCKNASKARYEYCAMAVQLDDSFGLLESVLKDTGLWDETLILATTDNGGMVPWSRKPGAPVDTPPPFPGSVGSNYPLRGSKATLLEGGVRSLGFLTGGWLDARSRGVPHEGLAHAVDLPALALRAALGTPRLLALKKQLRLDGHAVPSIRFRNDRADDAASELPVREEVPINIIDDGKAYSAIRFGSYKLLVGETTVEEGADGWFPLDAQSPPLPAPTIPAYQTTLLFDLSQDPYETNDLTNEKPEVVREGLRRLRAYIESGDYREPQPNTMQFRGLPIFHRGLCAPFLRDGETSFTEEDALAALRSRGISLEEVYASAVRTH